MKQVSICPKRLSKKTRRAQNVYATGEYIGRPGLSKADTAKSVLQKPGMADSGLPDVLQIPFEFHIFLPKAINDRFLRLPVPPLVTFKKCFHHRMISPPVV